MAITSAAPRAKNNEMKDQRMEKISFKLRGGDSVNDNFVLMITDKSVFIYTANKDIWITAITSRIEGEEEKEVKVLTTIPSLPFKLFRDEIFKVECQVSLL